MSVVPHRRLRGAAAVVLSAVAVPLWASCSSDGTAPASDGSGGAALGGSTASGGSPGGGASAGGSAGRAATGGSAGAGGKGVSAGGAPEADASTEDDTCADSSRKRCGGFCVTPRPAVGCTLSGCTPCPDVPYGRATCDGDRCGFACNAGSIPTANGCLPGEGGVTVSCTNSVLDGKETDVDCGGGECPACALGKGCDSETDCESGDCDPGTKKCICTKLTCGDVSGACGTLSDGCGGQITCSGNCGTGDRCFNGRCCSPRTVAECAANACDLMDDGCGGKVDCGGCTPPAVCGLVVVGQCSSSGTGCGVDSDFDGADDCAEDSDGDPFTDKNVFNGVSAQLLDACSTLLNDCAFGRINTLSKVQSCVSSKTVLETRKQFSGWDFTTTEDQSCNPGYGFQPTWTTCRNRFAIDATATLNVKAAGDYCFQVDGETTGQCGAFFLDADTTALQSGSAARCYTLTAGQHTVHWYYNVGSGAGNRRFRILYCQGSNCTPATALPPSLLRAP